MTQLAYSRTSKQRNQHVRNFLSLLPTLYSSSCTVFFFVFVFIETYHMCHFLFCKWKFIVFLFGYVFISCAFVMFPSTDQVAHFQLESAQTVCSVPSSGCLQAPWLVQQLCLCCYAQRRLRHPTKARVHKRNRVGKMHNLQSPRPLHTGVNEVRAVLID